MGKHTETVFHRIVMKNGFLQRNQKSTCFFWCARDVPASALPSDLIKISAAVERCPTHDGVRAAGSGPSVVLSPEPEILCPC
jgi:hypothetical protein